MQDADRGLGDLSRFHVFLIGTFALLMVAIALPEKCYLFPCVTARQLERDARRAARRLWRYRSTILGTTNGSGPG